MFLTIDCGNTYIKTHYFKNDVILISKQFSYQNEQELLKFIAELPHTTQAIFCSVKQNAELFNAINALRPCIYFTHTHNDVLHINYSPAESLGIDRLAAAIGAESLQANTNKLIIDFGTAITIDFVSEHGRYEGGNISPGLHTRLHALHAQTSLLPAVQNSATIPHLTSHNTKSAIYSGVVRGIFYEIEAYIMEYNTIFNNILVFFTGGDAIFFEKMLKTTIFAEPNLIAFGLYRILQKNAQK